MCTSACIHPPWGGGGGEAVQLSTFSSLAKFEYVHIPRGEPNNLRLQKSAFSVWHIYFTSSSMQRSKVVKKNIRHEKNSKN